MKEKSIKAFQKIAWDFYAVHRRDLPWRRTQDPYHILVSEVMLQQTQVDRVVPYYEKFLRKFPDFQALADAEFAELYRVWQGLGYNRRALALQRTAIQVATQFKGALPPDPALLETLDGIGPYTARAVAIFSWNTPVACLETNIRRVFIHHFFPKKISVGDKEIMALAEKALDREKPREWHWALMDYGAFLKKITVNPNRRHASYRVQPKFEGSVRQARGGILRALELRRMSLSQLASHTQRTPAQTREVISVLIKEGFVTYDRGESLFHLA